MKYLVTNAISLMVSEHMIGKEIEYDGEMQLIVDADVHWDIGTIVLELEDGKAFNVMITEKHKFGVPSETVKNTVKLFAY